MLRQGIFVSANVYEILQSLKLEENVGILTIFETSVIDKDREVYNNFCVHRDSSSAGISESSTYEPSYFKQSIIHFDENDHQYCNLLRAFVDSPDILEFQETHKPYYISWFEREVNGRWKILSHKFERKHTKSNFLFFTFNNYALSYTVTKLGISLWNDDS